MATAATSPPFVPPMALQQLPEQYALQRLYEILQLQASTLLSTLSDLPPADLPAAIAHHAPSLAADHFDGDTALVIRTLHLAVAANSKSMMLWGVLRDLFSPISRTNPLINPDNPTLIQDTIRVMLANAPQRDEILSGMDYVSCPPARSILSPAAYLVDLLRIITSPAGFGETTYELLADEKKPSANRFLRFRRPDIYDTLLTRENTFDTIPYLDIVNDALAAVIVQNANAGVEQDQKVSNAFQVLAKSVFPFILPFHRPRHILAATLKNIGVPLKTVVRTVEERSITAGVLPLAPTDEVQQVSPGELREMLGLSQLEWDIIAAENIDPKDIMPMYGVQPGTSTDFGNSMDPQAFLQSMTQVNAFLARTGLSRDQLQDLLYQDLSEAEVTVGQSRVFFINDVDDGLGYLDIVQIGDEFNSDGKGITEKLQDLSWKKLDRIHRFIRLAMRTDWKYSDLDWALRAIHLKLNPEVAEEQTFLASKSLLFDGFNDYVSVGLKTGNDATFFNRDEFTVEAWVLPIEQASGTVQERTQMIVTSWEKGSVTANAAPVPANGDVTLNDPSSQSYSFTSLLQDYSIQWAVCLNSALQVCVGYWGAQSSLFITDKALIPGQYTHVAVRISKIAREDVEPVKVILNGRQQSGVSEDANVDDLKNGLPAVTIGTNSDESALLTFGTWFSGHMKEVRIWNKLQDVDEVRRLMFQRLTGYEYDLLGYWTLSESELGQVLDSSKYGHAGTLGGNNSLSIPQWSDARLLLDARKRLSGVRFSSEDTKKYVSVDLSGADIDLSKSSNLIVFSFWIKLEVQASHASVMSLGLEDVQANRSTHRLSLNLAVDDNLNLVPTLFEGDDISDTSTHRHDAFPTNTPLAVNDLYFVALYFGRTSMGMSIRPRDVENEWFGVSIREVMNPTLGTLQIGATLDGLLHDLKLWSLHVPDANMQDPISFLSTFDPLLPNTDVLVANWPMSQDNVSYDDEDGNLRITDTQLNGLDLLGRKRIEFAPTQTSPQSDVYQKVLSSQASSNLGTVLSMDSKSAIEIRSEENFGIGQMLQGTVGLWFKCAKVSPFERQLLFAHGDDDVGLTIYVQDNKEVVVVLWARNYDSKNARFSDTIRYALNLPSQLLVDPGEWYHMAFNFSQNTAESELSFQFKLFINGIERGALDKVPLPPTGNILLGGIPEQADGWIALESSEGKRNEMRADTFFSGDLLDFNIWPTPFNSEDLQSLLNIKLTAAPDVTAVLNVPLNAVHMDDNTDYTNLKLSTTESEKEPQFPADLSAKLYTEKRVLLTRGKTPNSSAYTFSNLLNEWKDYSLRGRLRVTPSSVGAGIILCSSSRLSDEGVNYRDGVVLLARVQGDELQFELTELPSTQLVTSQDGDADQYSISVPNITWYKFEISTKTSSDSLQVEAKVWMLSDPEPKQASLKRTFRAYEKGQVGLWGFGEGEKLFDDIIAYKGLSEEKLLFDAFEGKSPEESEKWVYVRSDLIDFNPKPAPFEPECFGWSDSEQHDRNHAIYVNDERNLFRGWALTNHLKTTLSGRMMFENDGGVIGIFVTNERYRYSWALVRSPFDTGRDVRSRDLTDAYKFRLESRDSNNRDHSWVEVPGIVPVHSRWYNFKLEFTESARTIVKVKLWEFGTDEPDDFQLVHESRARLERHDRFGVMGSGVGHKYFADISSTAQINGAADIVTSIESVWEADSWDGPRGDLVGFGSVQPLQSIVGTPASNVQIGSHTLFAPAIQDAKMRYEEVVAMNQYTVVGRVYREKSAEPFGLTVYNRIPLSENLYYDIEITGEKPYLRVTAGYGDRVIPDLIVQRAEEHIGISAGWFQFRIGVRGGDTTEVIGKIWKYGEPEPENNTFEAIDQSALRVKSGTFGIWAPNDSTRFEGLKLRQYLDLNQILSSIGDWNQFITLPSRYYHGAYPPRIRENIDRFVYQDEGEKIIIARPSDYESAYAVTSIPSRTAMTVSAQLQIMDAGGTAGIVLCGTSSRSEMLGVLVRSSTYNERGLMSLHAFTPGHLSSSRSRFLSLRASTERLRKRMDLKTGDLVRIFIEVRTVTSADGDTFVRVRAKVWHTSEAEPNYFPLVGYVSARTFSRYSAHGFGLYAEGDGEKRFIALQISDEVDMVPSGNQVGRSVQWVNSDRLSVEGVSQTEPEFESVIRADKSLLYLQKDVNTPRLSRLQLLQYSDQQFMTALISGLSWTFRTGIVNEGAMGPILSVLDYNIDISILQNDENPPRPVLVFDDHDGAPVEFHLEDGDTTELSLSVSSSESGEELRLWSSGGDTNVVKRHTASKSSGSSLVFVGRKDSGDGRQTYFSGFMYNILLLNRSAILDAPLYLSHQSIAEKEAENSQLAASWPPVNSFSFLLGGDTALWSPVPVTEPFLKPFTSRSDNLLAGERTLCFAKGRAGEPGLLLRKNHVNLDTTEKNVNVRKKTVHVVFNAYDIVGSDNQAQTLFKEGEIEISVEGGLLKYIVGKSTYSVEIFSREWYSATLVWDAGRDSRPGALMCFLNGFPLTTVDGELLQQEASVQRVVGGGDFYGCIFSVIVFHEALTTDQVLGLSKNNGDVLSDYIDILLTVSTSADVIEDLSWNENSVSIQPVMSESLSSSSSMFEKHLEALAYVRELVDENGSNVTNAILPWGSIKDYGRGSTGDTDFDRLFNVNRQTGSQEWSLAMRPLAWSPDGTSISDWGIRSRLRSAAGVAVNDFDALLEFINRRNVVDGPSLTRLIMAARLQKLLGISATYLPDFMNLLSITFETIGPKEVVLLQRTLDWMREAGFEVDSALYHLGIVDLSIVTTTTIEDLSTLVKEEFSEFTVAAETFANTDLKEEEVTELVETLKTRRSGDSSPVLNEQGLVVSYFSEESYALIYDNPEWVNTLSDALFDFVETEYYSTISARGLENTDREFGERGILLRALFDLGFIFGASMHAEFSAETLRDQLSSSTTVGFQFVDSAEVFTILQLLSQDILPKWAVKAQNVEEALFSSRQAMENSLFEAIGTVFSLPPTTIRYAINGGYGGPADQLVALLVAEVFDAEDEMVKDLVLSCTKVVQLTVNLEMIDAEIQVLTQNPSVFGVSGKLDKLTLESLAVLSEYRRVREYVGEKRNTLFDVDIEASTADIVRALVSEQALTDASWSEFLPFRVADTAWLLDENVASGGETSRLLIIQNLWQICNVDFIASVLGGGVQILRDIAEATSFSDYEELVLASDEASKTSDGDEFERNLQEAKEQTTAASRDALLGLTVSIVTSDPEAYDSASIAVGEYLLLDVETGPPVLASRVQQAIQSVQLYIHRTLLGLERTDIDADKMEYVRAQWDAWLQNYRVWEAARRVYLYPENFLEPTLRSTSTPEFTELVRSVSEGTDESSLSSSILSYIESVGKVLSGLRIAGAGQSTSTDNVVRNGTLVEESVERLILVGTTTADPQETFVRQRISNGTEFNWLPWERVEQPISSKWVSPAFAFGKLHLFWISWKPEQVQYYAFNVALWNTIMSRRSDLITVRDDPDKNLSSEETEELSFLNNLKNLGDQYTRTSDKGRVLRLVEKDYLDENVFDNKERENWDIATKERPKRVTVPIMEPEIQFVIRKPTGTWTSPQSYAINDISLFGDVKIGSSEQILGDHRLPTWQRLYCARIALDQRSGESEERTITDPAVFIPSSTSEGLSVTTVLPVAQAMTFDVLSRIQVRSGASLNVYKGLERISEPITISKLTAGNFLENPPAELSQLRILRGSEKFALDLVLRRNSVWQDAASSVDSSLNIWLTDPLDTSGKTNSLLATQMALQGLLTELSNTNPTFEVQLRSIATNILQASDPDQVSAAELYNVGFSIKENEEYELHFSLSYNDTSSGSTVTDHATVPTSTVGLWSHFALEIDLGKTARLKYKVLNSVGDPAELVFDSIFTQNTDPPSIGSFFKIGEALVGDDDSLLIRCELSEARIWRATGNGDDRTFENVFREGVEAYRLSTAFSAALVGALPLDTIDVSSEFQVTDSLSLKVIETPPEEFDTERILIVLNGRIYGIQNNSKQTFDVEFEQGNFECLQLEMSKEPGPLNNSTASLKAFVRPRPPQTGTDSATLLDFFSGSADYEINPGEIEVLQEQRSEDDSRLNPELLLSNMLWRASTLQPVQDLFGVSVLEDGSDIYLLEATLAETEDPSMNNDVQLRRKMSDFFTLRREDGMLKLSIPDSDGSDADGAGQVKYKLQRVSSSASVRLEERLAKGGVDGLFSLSAQSESETEVIAADSDSNGTASEAGYGQIVISRFAKKVFPVEAESLFKSKFSAPDLDTAQSDLADFNKIDFDGINGLYFWELFLHVPLLVASVLNAGGEYARAQQWLEYVFRPIRNDLTSSEPYDPWQFQPFLASANDKHLDKILAVLGNTEQVESFRQNPFDAHNIAAGRPFAYQKYVFQKYVSNLLDYGDSLFIDDRESINRALLFYLQAAKVLGRRPREIPRFRTIEDTTPRTIEALRHDDVLRPEGVLMPDFVVPYVPTSTGDSSQQSTQSTTLDPVALMVSFCVPENDTLLQLWDRLEDRLFKIRNSLNIEGVFRQLDLFAPPIDPAALVSAVAGGASAIQAASNARRAVPHYRFDYMLQNAVEAAEAAASMAEDVLGAMETRDAESLALLEADQARRLNQFMVEISRRELQAASHERQALQITAEKIEMRLNRFASFLDNGERVENQYDAASLGVANSALSVAQASTGFVNSYGATQLKNSRDNKIQTELDKLVPTADGKKRQLIEKARNDYRDQRRALRERKRNDTKTAIAIRNGRTLQRQNATRDLTRLISINSGQSASKLTAAGLSQIPQVETGTAGLGPLVATRFSGEQLAKGLEIAADVLGLAGTVISYIQERAALQTQKQLDQQEWSTERGVAQVELDETRQQLRAAFENERAADAALDLVTAEGLAAEIIHAALTQKFTNADLYTWLSSQLSRMYRKLYNVAVDMARKAERGLQYELPTDRTFISGAGWNDIRTGLLAAKILQSELRQMANFRVEQDSRFLEIERKISLKNEFPEQFRRLIREEVCELEFSERMFDTDFPGHYFRVLKTVAVSVIPSGNGQIEQQTSLRATLTQTSNRVVMNPNIDTVIFLLTRSGEVPNNTNMRSNLRPNQTVALSKWRNDTGMFVVDYFFDDRYFSYEGTGAVSTWEFKIRADSNPLLAANATGDITLPALDFDSDDSVDIVFTLQYSAKADFGKFQNDVINQLQS